MVSGKICLILFSLCVGFSSAKIPSYIKVCKRSEDNIDGCIIDSINRLRSNLVAGIPELGVPSIDPFFLEKIEIKNNIQCNMTNIKLHGTSDFQILQLKSEIEKNRFAALLHLDKIFFEGDYVINSKFLGIPLQGSGPMYVNLTDINAAVKLKAKKINKKGITYFKFDQVKLTLSVDGRSDLRSEGLFKDQPTLALAARTVLQDNSKLFVDEVIPQMEIYLAEHFKGIANQITSHFTYDELFP